MSLGMELNDEVEATAFAGEVRSELKGLRAEMVEVKSDVKAILARIDKASGVAIGLSSLGVITGLAALWKAGP